MFLAQPSEGSFLGFALKVTCSKIVPVSLISSSENRIMKKCQYMYDMARAPQKPPRQACITQRTHLVAKRPFSQQSERK